MSPIGRKFIDSSGLRGRAYLAPKEELLITTKLAPSYDRNLLDESKRIRFYRNSKGYWIDTSNLVGTRAKINRECMVALANWIIEQEGARPKNKRRLNARKADLEREST